MSDMPSEISIPFQLGADQTILAETNPDAQIRQHVMSLVNTEPGERVVLGDYGVPLADSLFESADEVVAADVTVDISDAMSTYEPGIVIQNLTPVAGEPGDGLATIQFQYLRADAATTSIAISAQQNVAVITASGQVSEVIRS